LLRQAAIREARRVAELSRILYRGVATIGSFRCAPDDPRFRDSGPTGGHLLVFPREPVVIQHAGRAPVIADRARVMVYNQHQHYTRAAISPAGDRCEWFRFEAESILEARRDVAPGDRIERPFGELVHTRVDRALYLLARRAIAHTRGPIDPMWLDEACLALLDRALHRAYDARPRVPSAAHRELADAARREIARAFTGAWSLTELAASLGVSPFHLARVFRAVTGHTIHGYRTELRLRAAVERILDGEPLAPLAFELGFSSHSHFTQAFRAAFEVAPSKISTARRA
jgi:AraC-like DNA-binding protein